MTTLAFIVGVVLLVVGLAVSIALHEIGHLVPAKLFGVRVGRYMIGLGPTLFSRRFGETEYGVKALPVGGYISMSGMYPPVRGGDGGDGRAAGGFFATMVQDARDANEETLAGAGASRAFYELAVWQRVTIMLGGPIMNLVLAVVLFTIMFSGIGVQTATTTVAEVNRCVVASDTSQTVCTSDDPASPARAAGIRPGDEILSVDGVEVATFAEAAAIIQASPNRSLAVAINRGGETVTTDLTPMLAEREILDEDGNVTTAEVGFVGMSATVDYVRQPVWEGAAAAGEQTGRVAEVILQLPVRVYETAVDLFTGADRDPNGPLSVVGAGRIAGEVAAIDAPVINRVSALLGLLASLNIALFVFNLIPLLPLDGGHVAVALWDGLKRLWARLTGRPAPAPVDATRLVPGTFVVVVGLIVMGGILILADVFNPIALFG